jgi:hypothetical protein
LPQGQAIADQLRLLLANGAPTRVFSVVGITPLVLLATDTSLLVLLAILVSPFASLPSTTFIPPFIYCLLAGDRFDSGKEQLLSPGKLSHNAQFSEAKQKKYN